MGVETEVAWRLLFSSAQSCLSVLPTQPSLEEEDYTGYGEDLKLSWEDERLRVEIASEAREGMCVGWGREAEEAWQGME